MVEKNSESGRKQPLLYLPVGRLSLDPQNPRLPEEAQGEKEPTLLDVLYREFDLDELAFSLAQNGYFDEEPLVAIPNELPKHLRKTPKVQETSEYKDFIRNDDTTFTVVEGNRRLASMMILLSAKRREELGARHWPKLLAAEAADFKAVPTIIYPLRSEVIPYLGIRHIVGIKKWDAYAKARYIATTTESGTKLDDIQDQMGDRQNSARKHYLCYRLAQQAKEEFEFDLEPVKNNFSYLMLSIGQGAIKRFLGIPAKLNDVSFDAPVTPKRLDNLKNLMSWLYGEGKKTAPVVKESRDITNLLAHVLESEDALRELERTRDLHKAYELSDGEEAMLMRSLGSANRKLELALGVAHRHRTPDVISEVKLCSGTADRLLETVNAKN